MRLRSRSGVLGSRQSRGSLWPVRGCAPVPFIHPAKGPPQAEFEMGFGEAQRDEVAQDLSPDDFDQSPDFDPADPDPIPQDDFHQSLG